MTINFPKYIFVILFIIILPIMLLGCNYGKELVKKVGFEQPKMVELINKVRENGRYCGDKYYPSAKKINLNSSLSKAANIHSKDMSKNSFFRHKGSDDSFAGDRVKKTGYDWKICGENILFGVEQEERVILRWLQSENHCKIIMEGKFKEMGISKVRGNYKGIESYFWTLVMASPI